MATPLRYIAFGVWQSLYQFTCRLVHSFVFLLSDDDQDRRTHLVQVGWQAIISISSQYMDEGSGSYLACILAELRKVLCRYFQAPHVSPNKNICIFERAI